MRRGAIFGQHGASGQLMHIWRNCPGWPMRLAIGTAACVMLGGRASAAAPIYDSIALNIGLNCQWQQSCIRKHSKAKSRALKYVAKYQPPSWRIQLCNRNARRGTLRVDWVGFDHCVRNAALSEPPPPPPPAPPRKKRSRR